MPVVIGGVRISPGDVIMGDDDGVVVLGSDLDKIQAREGGRGVWYILNDFV